MKHHDLIKNIVKTLKECSKDTRLKVGAVLLKEGRIVCTGFNGQPHNQPHEKLMIDGHDVSTVHAEMNILCYAAKIGIAVKDCEIVVSHFPCMICLKHLYQAGIKKVYYLEDYRNEENPYKDLLPIEKLE